MQQVKESTLQESEGKRNHSILLQLKRFFGMFLEAFAGLFPPKLNNIFAGGTCSFAILNSVAENCGDVLNMFAYDSECTNLNKWVFFIQ